ncbi:hypothetical protein B0H10DRAFT_2304126 [Mycena sp. CBHHK59/15]|nr:hypothetical protein B0H10DRAFT_2304126 [Mycena sp. CBHHK59/15]
MEDDKANPRDDQQPRFPSSTVAMGKRCKTRKNGNGKSSNALIPLNSSKPLDTPEPLRMPIPGPASVYEVPTHNQPPASYASDSEMMAVASDLVPYASRPALPARCSTKHCVREVVDVVCMGKGMNDTSLLVPITSRCDDGPVVEDSPLEELSLDASEAHPADAQSCCTDAEAEGVICGAHPLGQPSATDTLNGRYTHQDYATLFPDVSWNQSLAAYADLAQSNTLICDVVTSSLLESYHEECKLDAAKDPSGFVADKDLVAELKAMHPAHLFQLRLSTRLINRVMMEATVPPPEAQRKRKRPHTQGALGPNIKRFCKDVDNCWVRKGELVVPNNMWAWSIIQPQQWWNSCIGIQQRRMTLHHRTASLIYIATLLLLVSSVVLRVPEDEGVSGG